jgi:hypothetical protein
MKKAFHAIAASLLLAGPAAASVTADLDRKVITYSNDNDGMQYTITKGERQSVRWDDARRFPLASDGTVRYSVNFQTNQAVPYAKPGRAGLTFTRPLADGEVAQITQSTLKITEAMGSGSLALDPDADPGPVVATFDAWQGEHRRDCRIQIFEKAVDICGSKFGRAGVVNWTMSSDLSNCAAIGCYSQRHDFVVGYQSREGRKAVSFLFVHAPTARRFVQTFSAWGGSNPQRI